MQAVTKLCIAACRLHLAQGFGRHERSAAALGLYRRGPADMTCWHNHQGQGKSSLSREQGQDCACRQGSGSIAAERDPPQAARTGSRLSTRHADKVPQLHQLQTQDEVKEDEVLALMLLPSWPSRDCLADL